MNVHQADSKDELRFPTLEPTAAEAVYRGFGGNFETAVEMLSLALAEEKQHHSILHRSIG